MIPRVYELYDSKRVQEMGWDEGHLGTANTLEELDQMIQDWKYWEGDPLVRARDREPAPVSWFVYLITSGNRTYIGSTTDPERRLRQHNREIRGGARATAGRKWKSDIIIGGFATRSEACRWEKIAKSRARGVLARRNLLNQLTLGVCPPGNYYKVPSNLYVYIIHTYMGESKHVLHLSN